MTERKSARVAKSTAPYYDESSLVHVIVGMDKAQKKFVAYAPMITRQSEFFRRALNGKWVEAETRTVKLPEDDPETFRLWLNFTYTGQLATMEEDPFKPELLEIEVAEHRACNEFLWLTKLYVLGEKFQDDLIQDAALTAIWATAEERYKDGRRRVPSAKSVSLLYEGTPDKSPARRLFVDRWSTLESNSLTANALDLPKAFFKDLAIHLLDARYDKNPSSAFENGIPAYLHKKK